MWWLVGAALLVLAAGLAFALGRHRRQRRSTGGAQLSVAEKLTVASIVSSTVLGLLSLGVSVVGLVHGSDGGKADPTPGAHAATGLRLASVTVQDSTVDRPGPVLDLKVSNVGGQVSVLTAVTMTVRSYGVLQICEAGGALRPTATYPVALPAPAVAGEVVSAPIGQELAPNTADNFQLTIGTRTAGPGGEQPAGFHVYVLDLAIEHDGEQEPLPGGAAVLFVPAITEQAGIPDFSGYLVDETAPTFDEASYALVLPCYRSNRELLQRALAVDGARPPALMATRGLG